jgi:hypothetical protein
MMDLDFDDTMLRGLHRYVRLVTQSLGLRGECSYVQADEIACAYIALDGRLSRFPDRDVALLWDQEHGWSAALETHSGEDLLAVADFYHDVLPPPPTVARWVENLFRLGAASENPDRGSRPPLFGNTDDLLPRLAAYTTRYRSPADTAADDHTAQGATVGPAHHRQPALDSLRRRTEPISADRG